MFLHVSLPKPAGSDIEPAVAPCHGPELQPLVDRGLQVDRRFLVVADRGLLGIACHLDSCANRCAAVMAMGHASHRAPAADEEALECPGDLPEEEERSLCGLGEAGWPAGAGAACLGVAVCVEDLLQMDAPSVLAQGGQQN